MDPYVCKTLILFLCQRRDPMITLIHRVLYRFNTLTLYSYFTWAPPPTLILVLKICFDHLTLLDGHTSQFLFHLFFFFFLLNMRLSFSSFGRHGQLSLMFCLHIFSAQISLLATLPPPPPPLRLSPLTIIPG